MLEPTRDLVRDCEAAELGAVRSWCEAIPAPVVESLGFGHRMLGDGIAVHALADVLMFNRVLGLGVSRPSSEVDLDLAIEQFTSTGAKRFMVQVAPDARPVELETWLGARGFLRYNHWIRLVHELRAVDAPRTDLRIAAFGREHADEFGRMQAEAFGQPPELAALSSCLVGRAGWSFQGAFDGKSLVAVSAMYARGPVAWLGFASTLKTHRKRGAQSALIAARLNVARHSGCRWACVETAADTPEKPNPSTHNLRRLGFIEAYDRPNWVKVLRAG